VAAALGMEVVTRVDETAAPSAGRRTVRVQMVGHSSIRAAWRGKPTHTLLDRRLPSGESWLRIEHERRLGYLFRAPSCGRFWIRAGADRIDCAPARGAAHGADWEAFLANQVLPFAALLNGMEVLHASAVAIDGGAVAIVAPTCGGKSSIAARLLLRGAALVTDDVLALEPAGAAVLAHPGPTGFKLRPAEAERLTAAERRRLGPARPVEADVRFDAPPVPAPVPLRAVYVVERGAPLAEPLLEPATDPRVLLAATFNTVLTTPERLLRQLEVCAGISETARVMRAAVPPEVGAAELAELLERDVRAA
jgi:hypothetical protein